MAEKRCCSWFIISSGLVRYRRGRDRTTHKYVLEYSADGGFTWETLQSLELTEDNILMEDNPDYRRRIVGTQYRIDNILTSTGYSGAEGTDWENIYTT